MTANRGEKITELWAWVALDEDGVGGEGVCSFYAASLGTHMPMMGADRERMLSLMPMAQIAAKATGKTVELRRFTTMITVETVSP